MRTPGLEELITGIQRLLREAIALKPDKTQGEGERGVGPPELVLTGQSRDKDGLILCQACPYLRQKNSSTFLLCA